MQSVLVVDDEPELVKLISRHLERNAYRVIGAKSAEEALQIIGESATLDIAIVDFWLGAETSVPVLEALGARWPEMPVIVISGGGGGSVPLEVSHSVARLSGAAHFIQKPFSNGELLSKLRAALKP